MSACGFCSYVPSVALENQANDVMAVWLVRVAGGSWSAHADGLWGDSTSFERSTDWDAVRARERCDQWLGHVSLPRVAAWVCVPDEGPDAPESWHAHCVMDSDFERCSVCGCMVVGGTGLKLSRGDRDVCPRQFVLCSKVDCLASVLDTVRGFHRSAVVADVPLWPGVS